MKETFLPITLFFLCIVAFSQTPESLNNYQFKIDSLKNVLTTAKSDSLKCILHFKLSYFYRKWNKNEDYIIHKEIANTLIHENDYLEGLSYYFNSHDYYIKSDYEGYLKNLQIANDQLKHYSFKENYSLRATILNNQTIGYQVQGKEKEAYRILVEEAMPLAIKSEDPNIIGVIYSNMAQLSHNNRNYEMSKYYYKKAIKELEKNAVFDKDYLIHCYMEYAKKLIKLEKMEGVDGLLAKIKSKLAESPLSEQNSNYFYLKGYYYFYRDEYEKALKALNEGIESTDSIKNKRNLLSLKLLKSNALMSLKRYSEAKPLLIEYLNDPEILIGNKRDFTRNLAEVYIHLNDNENAIKYFNRFAILSDSLDEVASRNVISNLEAKFNKAENEKKIISLESEKELVELSAQNNRLYNWLLGISLFFISTFSIVLLSSYRRGKKLAYQKEINYKQLLKETEQIQQLNSVKAMLKGEEKERKRIARDLHDGLGGVLAGIKMNLSKISEKQQMSDNSLDKILDKVDYSLVELRRIAQNMLPEVLLRLGLDAAIQDLCSFYRTVDLKIEYLSFQIEHNISQQNQLIIYRIVQELLSNSIKHSGASWVLLQCSQNQNTFFITIEDNGRGFEIDKLSEHKGMGLDNIKNRVAYLSGKLEIDSKPGEGATIHIELNISK